MSNKDLHHLQAGILRDLLFVASARFSNLRPNDIESDKFTFHLQQLQQQGLIEKTDMQEYTLTAKGKEFANRLDTDTNTLERQAKVSVVIVGRREAKGQTEYLVHKRLKQPFYGYLGIAGGKIRWGETILEAAARELQEETGLFGELTIQGVEHKMDYSEDGSLLEEKYFFIVRADNLTGDLLGGIEGGRNFWMSLSDIRKNNKKFPDLETVIQAAEDQAITIQENKFTALPDAY